MRLLRQKEFALFAKPFFFEDGESGYPTLRAEDMLCRLPLGCMEGNGSPFSDGVFTDAESSDDSSEPEVLIRECDPFVDRGVLELVNRLMPESIRGSPPFDGEAVGACC